MLTIRKSAERGHFDHGWLKTYHTFSFADYHDDRFMSFRDLRVINEDFVAAGKGFPTHGHKDFEILTYLVSGSLAHKDSMGNGTEIRAQEIQRMSAGTGVTHSEFNPSANESTHLLQIWIKPDRQGHTPSYEQKMFDAAAKQNKLCLIASQDGREGSIHLNQDVNLYASCLDLGQSVSHKFLPGRHAWLQLVKGEILVNDMTLLSAGDGLAVAEEKALRIMALAEAEFLLFDLV